jgi:hypothetical protein
MAVCSFIQGGISRVYLVDGDVNCGAGTAFIASYIINIHSFNADDSSLDFVRHVFSSVVNMFPAEIIFLPLNLLVEDPPHHFGQKDMHFRMLLPWPRASWRNILDFLCLP